MRYVLALPLLLLTFRAIAMECMPDSFQGIAERAELAFIGTAKIVEQSSYKPSELCLDAFVNSDQCGGKLIEFKDVKPVKGKVPGRVSVLSEDPCNCLGQPFVAGTRYLVVARRNNLKLRGDLIASNICSGTRRADKGSEILVRALKAADK